MSSRISHVRPQRLNETLLLEASLALTLAFFCFVFLFFRGHPLADLPSTPLSLEEPQAIEVVPQVQPRMKETVVEQPARRFAPIQPVDDLPLAEPEKTLLPAPSTELPLPPPPPLVAESEPVPFFSLEVEPELIGGLQALYSRIVYPEFARRAGVEGQALIAFVLGKDGVPREFEILAERPPQLEFGKAAIEALSGVRFTPGMQRDRLVEVRMQQAVRFQLQN